MSLRQSGAEKVAALVNAVKGLITAHNSSSSAHSTEMAKKVNVAQGSGNSGKFLKVNSSGNVACESVTIPDVSGKIDTAGTGLSKSGTTLNHSNSITAQTTATFKKVKYDAQGHITGTADVAASDLPTHYHSQYLSDHQDISGKEDTSNKVTSISSSSTDTEYPSARAVYTAIQSGGGSVVVVDNLTTDDGTKALSCRQGKVLNDRIGDAITYINQ